MEIRGDFDSAESFALLIRLPLIRQIPKNIFVGVGNLIYKSQDGGTNWSVQKLNAEKRIARILIDSNNPQSVFLGMKNAKEQSRQSF